MSADQAVLSQTGSTLELADRLKVRPPDVISLHGTAGGKPCIASGGDDGSLRMWGLDGFPLATIDIDEKITALAALPGIRYAIGTPRGLVLIETG